MTPVVFLVCAWVVEASIWRSANLSMSPLVLCIRDSTSSLTGLMGILGEMIAMHGREIPAWKVIANLEYFPKSYEVCRSKFSLAKIARKVVLSSSTDIGRPCGSRILEGTAPVPLSGPAILVQRVLLHASVAESRNVPFIVQTRGRGVGEVDEVNEITAPKCVLWPCWYEPDGLALEKVHKRHKRTVLWDCQVRLFRLELASFKTR